MHKQGMLHRDIKLANVACHRSKDTFSLIDFGCACQIPKGKKSFEEKTLRGTVEHIAPELVPHMEKYIGKDKPFYHFKDVTFKAPHSASGNVGEYIYAYTAQTDIYAFGILLQELFGKKNTVLQTQGQEITFSLPKSFENDASLESLLKSMVEVDCRKRPSIDTIIKTLASAQKNPRYQLQLSDPCLINTKDIETILKDEDTLNTYRTQDIIYLTATENTNQLTDWVQQIQTLKAKGLPISPIVIIGSPEHCQEKARQLNQDHMKGINLPSVSPRTSPSP